MRPEETQKVSDFIKATLTNHTSADIQNAAKETIGRTLGLDELIAFALYMEEDKRYKLLTVDDHHGYVIFKNPNYEIQEKQNRKLHYEALLAKWTYYTYWVVFVFSIAGLIISIIALTKKG